MDVNWQLLTLVLLGSCEELLGRNERHLPPWREGSSATWEWVSKFLLPSAPFFWPEGQ